MLKLIRKYKLILLVIGGVFLMIAFLAPQAIQQIGRQQMGRTVATIGDEKVSAADMQRASLEFAVAEQLAAVMLGSRVFGENDRHWLLLTEAADRAGLVDRGGRGQMLLAQLQQDEMGQQLYQVLMRGRGRMTGEDVALAISKALAVLQLREMHNTAARISEPMALHLARRSLDRAVADTLLIPGSLAPEAREMEIDEQALREHFQRYRDVRPEESEAGVGYVLPPRVRLEYLKLDRPAIEQAAPVRPLDVIETYRANPEDYPGGRDEDDQEARRQAREQALQRVEQDLRQAEADRIMSEAAEVIRRRVYEATSRLERQDGYLRTGGERIGPAFDALADTVVAEVTEQVRERSGDQNFTMPRPEVVVRGADWLTASDLAALPGIGNAALSMAGRRVPFAEYAMQVRAIAGRNDARLQVGVPAVESPAVGPDGSRYFFTILDARPQGPARSLEEVRERVEADIRSLRGLEALRARSDEIRSLAVDEGLQAVADALSPPDQDEQTQPLRARRGITVTREAVYEMPPEQIESFRQRARQMGQSLPAGFGVAHALNAEAFRERLMEAAETLDPRQPVDEYPAEQRTVVVPLEQRRALAIGRIQGLQPLTVERYLVEGESAAERARSQEFAELRGEGEDPFSFQALAERLEFTERTRSQDEAPAGAGEAGEGGEA